MKADGVTHYRLRSGVRLLASGLASSIHSSSLPFRKAMSSPTSAGNAAASTHGSSRQSRLWGRRLAGQSAVNGLRNRYWGASRVHLTELNQAIGAASVRSGGVLLYHEEPDFPTRVCPQGETPRD